MTAATLTRLPMQATGYAFAYAGRAAMWIIARYMRNPLTHTAIAALVATSALAASNALFMQTERHPSPWFANASAESDEPTPVVPATRPANLTTPKPAANLLAPRAVAPETTASVSPATEAPSTPIGNRDVFEVQTKLALLKLFTGTIDGYYGPQTAGAIRRFEEIQGLKPTGQLTRETIERILAAPDTLTQPKPDALRPAAASPAPAPATTTPAATLQPASARELVPAQVQVQVAPQKLAEIAAPAPLAAPQTTGSVGTQAMAPTRNTFLGRPLPTDANEAVEMASDTANEAIDTIASGVAALADMTRPEAPPAAVGGTTVASLASVPTPGVPLKIEDEPTKPGEAIAELSGSATPEEVRPVSVTDPVVVARIQRGLASLGFLHGPADGVAGEATAKAIRNFEVYYNYDVTGRISPGLLDLLVANGAAI